MKNLLSDTIEFAYLKNDYMTKTWFVTGGTGLVGSTIISKLLETEAEIIALVREDSDVTWLLENKVTLCVGNLEDINSFKYDLGASDIIVHAGAMVEIGSPSQMESINVGGTKNIINAMREFGVKRLIHISTVGVYGTSNPILIVEDQIPNPIGSYSKSKLDAEKIILNATDINSTILRPPYIIGYVNKDRHIIPNLIKFGNRSILPRLWRFDNKIGFVHARDIASAVLIISSYSNTKSTIYNIQSFDIKISELVDYLSIALGRKIFTIPIPITLLYIGAAISDLFNKIMGKPTHLYRRIQGIRYSWSFSSKKLSSDIHWKSQYTDKKKLFSLLSKYVSNHLN